MAEFTRVHGDSLPLVNMDAAQAGSSTGVPINPAGPKLDFFTIDLGNGSPVNQMGTGGAIEAVIRCAQQLATVHIYQVEDVNGQNLSLAVYPTGAWTASTLSTAIEGLGTVNGYSLSSAVVQNNGFRLLLD